MDIFAIEIYNEDYSKTLAGKKVTITAPVNNNTSYFR